MLLCVITDIRLFLFLLFNPIPLPSLSLPSCFRCYHPFSCFPLKKGKIVCKYHYSRLRTLAVHLDRWSDQPLLMFTFLRCSRADLFLCWLCAHERKGEGHKCVLKCEGEQQTRPQQCCREVLDPVNTAYLQGTCNVWGEVRQQLSTGLCLCTDEI